MPRKPKSEPAAAQWNQRAKLIEEYAALDQEVSNFRARALRHSKLREIILGWYPGLAAEEEALAPGVNYDIVVSSRDKVRFVTADGKQKLFRLWGSQKFVATATVLLKNLPDSEDKAGLYTQAGLTGPRHLRVIAKARGAAAEPAA